MGSVLGSKLLVGINGNVLTGPELGLYGPSIFIPRPWLRNDSGHRARFGKFSFRGLKLGQRRAIRQCIYFESIRKGDRGHLKSALQVSTIKP